MSTADNDDTLVYSIGSGKKPSEPCIMRLVPFNAALTEELVLSLSQLARIGRAATGTPNHPNFYGVQSKVVSRAHVDIWEAEGRFYIRDLGSASGSFINGKRISAPGVQSNPVELHPDNLLQLGTNYTEDEAALNNDRTLRCIQVKCKFMGRPLPVMSVMTSGMISPVGSGSPGMGEVDLNNLTHVIKTAQKSVVTAKHASPESIGSPVLNSPVLHSPPLTNRSSREELVDPKKSADIMQFELSRKKELEEKLKDVQLKANSALSSVTASDREQMVVSILKQNFKVMKVSIQLGTKDVITVNVKPWDQSKKLLLQDHRPKFSKSPYVELIMDASVQSGNKYHAINHNGGTIMATIEKLNDLNGVMELANGSIFRLQGELADSYTIVHDSKVVAEVNSQENTRNMMKGNLTRTLSVMVEKDHVDQLLLLAVVVMGLICP